MYDGLGNRAGKPPQAEAEADQGRAYSLPVPAWNASGVYSTELWGNVAVQLIQQHDFERDRFFMYLAFQAPHAPVQPSPDKALNDKCKTLTRGQGRDTYCSMVSYMDRKIGEVVATFKARGHWDNTLLIFSSGECEWVSCRLPCW